MAPTSGFVLLGGLFAILALFVLLLVLLAVKRQYAGAAMLLLVAALAFALIFPLFASFRAGPAATATMVTQSGHRVQLQEPGLAPDVAVEVSATIQVPTAEAPNSREHRAKPHGIGWWLLSATAVIGFIFVAYVFLDAGTRGQFTWPLRILSLIGAGIVFAVVSTLRNSL